MRTLFLNPPFTDRYDSAGARFQATRRTRSMWYPIWLAHAAALSSGDSRLVDGPASGLKAFDVVEICRDYDCVVFYTSTPSFNNDAAIASLIKKKRSDTLIVFTGPHVSALPEESLQKGDSVDIVTIGEFEHTIKEIINGVSHRDIKGIAWRDKEAIHRNAEREPVEDLDSLPFVSPIYKRFLPIGAYYLPFTLFPYIAIYSGRGCPYQCSFCLWPQTFTGRRYRKRSISNIIEEVRYIKGQMPQIKEIFFDDDTFTVNKDWVMEFCDSIQPLGVRFSINARADIPPKVLQRLKRAGCRLLVVGYESGNQAILDTIRKGLAIQQLIDFSRDAKDAGLMIHGTFMMGLPGETRETVQQTIDFAKALPLDTVQCSILSPLPGTELYDDLIKKGYLHSQDMVSNDGFQSCPLNYPDLSSQDIEAAAHEFHKAFYLRSAYAMRMMGHFLRGPEEAYRVFSVGWEYLQFVMRHRHF